MRTFLLTWNPKKWPWDEKNINWWRFNSKKAKPGDRFFLIRLGVNPKGIFASGTILAEPWTKDNRYFVDIDYDVLLDSSQDSILGLSRLNEIDPRYHWTPFPSGIEIPTDTAEKLAAEWTRFVNSKTLPAVGEGIEKRYARLTWNTHGWVMPSGRSGKSRNGTTHEGRLGYGHEEWLFDTSKIIDGFHYGFLEPIQKDLQTYIGNRYNVWLYTLDGSTKKRYWVGEINNVQVIDKSEKDRVKKIYKERGWHDEMKGQLNNYGLDGTGSHPNFKVEALDFNVKFDPKDVHIRDQYRELPLTHPVYRIPRYTFGYFKKDFNLSEESTYHFTFTPSESDAVSSRRKPVKYIRVFKEVEMKQLHRDISDALTLEFVRTFGKKNVRQEHPHGKNSVDIVVSDQNRIVFYEIKTYSSIVTSIREALGQLLEYGYYPDQENADELIIVSQHKADAEIKRYMTFLRDRFKLPLHYCSFDINSQVLSNKV